MKASQAHAGWAAAAVSGASIAGSAGGVVLGSPEVAIASSIATPLIVGAMVVVLYGMSLRHAARTGVYPRLGEILAFEYLEHDMIGPVEEQMPLPFPEWREIGEVDVA